MTSSGTPPQPEPPKPINSEERAKSIEALNTILIAKHIKLYDEGLAEIDKSIEQSMKDQPDLQILIYRKMKDRVKKRIKIYELKSTEEPIRTKILITVLQHIIDHADDRINWILSQKK